MKLVLSLLSWGTIDIAEKVQKTWRDPRFEFGTFTIPM